MKEKNYTEKVRPKNAPPGFVVRRYQGQPLSDEAKQNLRDLAAMPDSAIDYSDIPPLTQEFWKNAVRNPFYKPVKKQLTLRVDADIIAWAKQKGAGYQTLINDTLRKAMLADRGRG